MILAIAILYFGLFSLLAYKNFKMATALFILLLPFYFVRFNVVLLPSTILEFSFGALFVIWSLKYLKQDFKNIKYFFSNNKILLYSILVFFLASISGLFVSSELTKSLGVWRAYFLEPILFFILLIGRSNEIKKDDLIWFLSLSTISISVVAILQKITGQTILTTIVANDLEGRVTSFFTSPNAVGLYLAPIVPLSEYGMMRSEYKKYYASILMLIFLALYFSFSEGALVALAVGGLIFLFLSGYKKTSAIMVIIGLILLSQISVLQNSLLFKNQSGKNRLVIWGYTWNYLNTNPKNFILGAGESQFFKKIQMPVNNFKEIEPLIFPHNIALNFWSEIGLFGMLSFFAIYLVALKKTMTQKIFSIAGLTCLVIFLVHGLVDVPYFKNDLSFLWWIILSIIYI